MDAKPKNTAAKQEIDYTKFIRILLSRWYWIVGTTIMAAVIAYAYLWYTPKMYSTAAYVKFEEKQPDLTAAVSLSNYSRSYTNKIAAESWTFKSRRVMERAVEYIDWRITYSLNGRIRNSDLYPEKPFKIIILQQDSTQFYNKPISFKKKSATGYEISYPLGGKTETVDASFGRPVKVPGVIFSIENGNHISETSVYNFKFNHKYEFYGRIGSGFNISEAAKYSSVAMLTKTDPNPYFAADAINAIIRVYRELDLEDKTQSAKQIIDFIDQQLNNLSLTVRSSGEKLKEFKQNNNFLDLSNSSQAVLTKVTTMETENRSFDIQIILLKQLQQQLKKNEQNISLNFNLDGAIDPLLNSLVTEWNSLIQERVSLMNTYKANSKPILEIDEKLDILRNSANANMQANLNRMVQQKNYNQAQLDKAYQELSSLPQQERQLFGLQRDYDINEKIYSYLSEKKLEAQIGKASVLAGATVVDRAEPNTSPISPNTSSVWRTALLMGLASGIGLILLMRSLNPYIYDKETIESLTQIPIIGMVRHFPETIDQDNKQILTIAKPKSLFAESVRSVRTNLSFIASENQSKVICIGSEVAGEGKSFITINLASSLALIDKKVIFIAADLRRSKIHKAFGIKDKKGLSTYLANQDQLSDIIHHTQQENLDLIVAGPVPPNPAELMYSERMITLIEELKQRYDFILFDTAPIGLVSDALPLIKLSDINIFVIRTGKSKYSAASVPGRITGEYHLKNTFIILNDFVKTSLYSNYYSTKYNDSYYGYYYADSEEKGYGYYEDDHQKQWWKKIFNA